MIAARWLLGLIRRRPVELGAAAAACAITCAFLACLGAFISQSRAHMTERALASLPVAWQVQATPGTSITQLQGAAGRLPHVSADAPVQYAAVPGFEATVNGTVRATGKAFVVALPDNYAQMFPGTLRSLVGSAQGPQLLQQTAANLSVTPGGTALVRTASGTRVPIRVNGVSEMPSEDSFFQVVGAAPGAGATAPPDNVLLVPPALFGRLANGSQVVRQVHVAFDKHWLPADPGRAFTAETRLRNHFESSLTGAALVGDNAEVALSSAREDGLYAQLLFLLLGIPGVALAVAVTLLVVTVRVDRRRRELALVRIRGMSASGAAGLVAAEAVVVGVAGAGIGLLLARGISHWALGNGRVPPNWLAVGAAAAVVVSLFSHFVPLHQALRPRAMPGAVGIESVAVPRGQPWPLRYGVDAMLLGAAALVFWLTANSNYQVVVAPEGLATTSVNYAALLAPAFAWPGLALLVWRLVDLTVSRMRGRPRQDGRELVAASVRRRRRLVARSAAGLAVALAVTSSTAVFAATYETQSRLDVALTVGADVAVKEPPSAHVNASYAGQLRRIQGVRAVGAQQHRFAYVGSDLQDLYGIDPATISASTPLRNSFTPGETVNQALHTMANTPDGVLLAAETLHDYQLRPGDTIRLRLQVGPHGRYTPVPFRVVGEVREWPTAPKDSFIVANAAYITHVTGSADVGAFLIRTSSPQPTAARVSRLVGASGATVDNIESARTRVTTASGLAATDVAGLKRLELGFGSALAVAMFGLALLVTILDRRRALVILGALGATARQRSRFVAAEARVVLIGGLLGGIAIGAAIAYLLIKVLTGIFDPAPDHASIPWGYLCLIFGLATVTASAIVAVMGRLASRAGLATLREL